MSEVRELLGYTDAFEALPGETITLRAAGPDVDATADLVRLRTFDQRVDIDRPREEPIDDVPARSVTVSPQPIRPGGFALTEGRLDVAGRDGIRLSCWVVSTLADPDGEQGIMALVGSDGNPLIRIAAAGGRLTAVIAGATEWRSSADFGLEQGVWAEVSLTVGLDGSVDLELRPSDQFPRHPGDGPSAASWTVEPTVVSAAFAGVTTLLVAASGAPTQPDRQRYAVHPFTGKIDSPLLSATVSGVDTPVVALDFAADMAADRVADGTGNGHHARLYNCPIRAVTGRRFDGSETDFRRVPEQYSAIHFHADDLEHPDWPAVSEVRLPADLPSGVYAIRLRTPEETDHVPVIVTPPAGGASGDVALLLPTWTYQAYANGRIYVSVEAYQDNGWTDIEPLLHARDLQLERNADLAGCVYDVHNDGSGHSWSSARRPVVNMRPEYLHPVMRAPRHFSADLYLSDFLEREIGHVDVLTDGRLHERGVDLLSPYRVVVTGSHPEYYSAEMLTALEQYLAGGGSLMYLGGNGFWWVTSQDPARPHLIQVRRNIGSGATWESKPGELHDSITGEQGGGWRRRGRSANKLVGVGIAAQGWDRKAPGYRRSPQSYRDDTSWIFEGVPLPEFGDYGLVLGGAAGDEIDRFDLRHGSSSRMTVVASSTGHSRFYKPIIEDVGLIKDNLSGDVNPEVRSDITYFPTGFGGAVFSVGSITWCGAMAVNTFDNDVARITANVLHRFRKDPA